MAHSIMKRFIGIDYGDKNIGIAVSDPLGFTAQGIEIIRRENAQSFKALILRIREIMREYKIDTIVLGYPKNMDGSEGFRCEKTLEFKERLHRNFKSAQIVLWDERLSSLSMHREMDNAGINKKKQSEIIDKLAAVYILQGYLDYLKNIEKS